MAAQDIFTTKVIPVMDKVRDDLCEKRADEIRKASTSFASLASMAADPYGQNTYVDTVMITGKWNTKTVEDYIGMVKKELQKQGVSVTKDMEKKMVDKMVKDKIPKSSIDYIIRKAATNSLFYIPTEIRKSQLEREIENKAETAYKPKVWEKGLAWGLGTGVDIASTGGFGGGLKTAATLAMSDAAMDLVTDKVIPMIIAPGQEKAYLADMERIEKEDRKTQKKDESKEIPKPETNTGQREEVSDKREKEQPLQEQEQSNGWDDFVKTIGFEGLTDIANNMGYILAMLPDMMIGLFTGKTKSFDLKQDMLPLASLVGGMFVKNPLLKTMMMGYGGANLINKIGHEALDRANAPVVDTQRGYVSAQDGNKYKIYPDEELNPRVSRPMISGNRLICNIDGVPCNVQLNDNIVQAHKSGSLPLNTLVNAIIARNDTMQNVLTDNYSDNQSQSIARSRGV